MTVSDASGTTSSRVQIVQAIMTHRQRGSDHTILEAIVDKAAGTVQEEPPPHIEYADGTLSFDLTAAQRTRLDALLEDFPVFKPKQPTTQTPSEGGVSLSAIADPKHTADFVDAVFQSVYEVPDGYTVRTTRE